MKEEEESMPSVVIFLALLHAFRISQHYNEADETYLRSPIFTVAELRNQIYLPSCPSFLLQYTTSHKCVHVTRTLTLFYVAKSPIHPSSSNYIPATNFYMETLPQIPTSLSSFQNKEHN